MALRHETGNTASESFHASRFGLHGSVDAALRRGLSWLTIQGEASIIADSRDPNGAPATSPKDELAQRLAEGASADELLALVYDELRSLAAKRMSGERAGHTLQATALVNEVYLRLCKDHTMQWRDRRHFFGAAAEAMRRVLVDHARRAMSEKRGGGRARLELTLSGLPTPDEPESLLALDDALDQLELEDARCAEVARLRLYAGLANEDVAAALALTPRTIQRDWSYARARLTEMLDGGSQ